MPTADPPAVSVCVSTRNRAAKLPRLMEALDRLDPPDGGFEVVLVDNGSSDDTPEVLARLHERAGGVAPLTTLRNEPGGGPSRGRNRAWRAARAPLVAFTDDDCIPDTGWLRTGAACFADGRPKVVAGAVRVHPSLSALQAAGPFAYVPMVEEAVAQWFATANVFFRRADLEAVGGFDEGFRQVAGEDTDLAWRVLRQGAESVFCAEAVVRHEIRERSVRTAVRDAAVWADLVVIMRRYPETRRALLHARVFWKPSHPKWLLMVLGLLLAARDPVALLLAAPWLHDLLCRRQLDELADWLTVVPGSFAIDAAEIVAMLRGSWRYRTLVL